MEYRLLYTLKAKKDLMILNKLLAKRILDKLDFFINTGRPLSFAKRLKNPSLGNYRFRIGDYRIIFDIDTKGNISVLLILKIGHRRDIYS